MRQRHRIIEVYGLWLADLLCIAASFWLSTYLRFGDSRDIRGYDIHLQVCLAFLLFCTVYNFFLDWNGNFIKRKLRKEIAAVAQYMILMFLVVESIKVALQWAEIFSRLVMAYFTVINFLLTLAVHMLIKRILILYYASDKTMIKVLVATEESLCESTLEKLGKELGANYQLTALACLDKGKIGEEIRGVPVVADCDNLLDMATGMALDEVFVYAPSISQKKVSELLEGFGAMGIGTHYYLPLFALHMGRSSLDDFGGYPVVSFTRFRYSHKRYLLKRLMDIAGSLVGIFITLLLFPFVAIAIKLESKGPIFFSQVRIGRNGRHFTIHKFRSMHADAEREKASLESKNEMNGLMFKIENDPRITKVGRFLRRTSIDELPQFFNILKGDMSMVGTRPPTVDEFERYNKHYRRRISMTPGLTGLWQVSGRSDINDFDEVVKYDLEYIDNWSLSLDIKILLRTLAVVFTRKGSK